MSDKPAKKKLTQKERIDQLEHQVRTLTWLLHEKMLKEQSKDQVEEKFKAAFQKKLEDVILSTVSSRRQPKDSGIVVPPMFRKG